MIDLYGSGSTARQLAETFTVSPAQRQAPTSTTRCPPPLVTYSFTYHEFESP